MAKSKEAIEEKKVKASKDKAAKSKETGFEH